MHDGYMCDAARKAAMDLAAAAANYGPGTPPDHLIQTMMSVANQLLTARGKVLGPLDPMADDGPWRAVPPTVTYDALQRAVAAQEMMETQRKQYAQYQQRAWDSGAGAMSFDDWVKNQYPGLYGAGAIPVGTIDDTARMNAAIEWGPAPWDKTAEQDPAPSTDDDPDAGNHSEECRALHKAWSIRQDHWRELFPKHCHTCNGWGWLVAGEHGRVPLASARQVLLTNDDAGYCPDCVNINKCPRCGRNLRHGLLNDGSRRFCGVCSWSETTGGLPVAPPCVCISDDSETEQGDDDDTADDATA